MDHILVEVIPDKTRQCSLFVLNLYSNPASKRQRFLSLFKRATDLAGQNPIVIGGDFNAPSTTWGYGYDTAKASPALRTRQPDGRAPSERSHSRNTRSDKGLSINASELSKLLADLLALNPDTADCPAPRVPVPRTRCRAHPCSSDDDCRWNSHRCCFNGCVFTCLPKLAPPPVIDWTKEVRPINASKAPKHFTGIVCSTAPVYAPAAPLQCPEGMVCVTKDVGDPLTGQPSMGECIVDPHAMTRSLQGQREKAMEQRIMVVDATVLKGQPLP
ncbi:hypothetical protein HPB50_027433 [Hyalomma asiaticum]|uniref:Uncharacterized protein n=1 Tax=Hyalomma asiaticum TaxID=266040 RepID=A0ACB7SKZ0_HYAAI|nr:hypothetical protein HPB50_027433 [Hyalomma asiaticum]